MIKAPTADRLSQLFAYDPRTGLIRWKATDRKRKAKSGAVAGCMRPDGYTQLSVDNMKVLGHVAAWALYHGTLPVKMLDHINRIRDDNRISNLREATQKDNLHNSLGRGNHAFPKGVSFTANGNFAARIRDGKKIKWLGAYRTVAEAEAAYREASLALHGDFSIYK